MTNSKIAITEGSGKNVDTRTTTTDGDHRQVVALGDPSVDNSIAAVQASDPASNAEGVVVRDPNSTAIVSGLRDVRVQSIVDGTVSVGNIDTITRVDRVFNIVDGTISLPSTQDLDTITRVDRVHNLVDGTISTVAAVTDITNTVAVYFDRGNPSFTAYGSQANTPLITNTDGAVKVYDLVDGTISTVNTVTRVDRVHNLVDGTVTLGANSGVDIGDVDVTSVAGTIAVVQVSNAGDSLYHTKTYSSVSNSVSGSYPSGKTVVGPDAGDKIKVYAISLTTTAQAHMVVKFENGAASTPTEYWRYALQAPSAGIAGANLAVTPPAYLFATAAGSTLAIQRDTDSLLHYSVSYFVEST